MDYQQAWTFLDQLQFFKIKLGLEAMRTFLGRLGHPEEAVPWLHIAGTNGKGSVGATLHACLEAAGLRTGLYTSPHLSSVRERFRIGSTFISREEFADLATEIAGVLDGDTITYFEFTTALAMLWFAREKTDLAILEVGMGGRLDATNVVSPRVSLITNVSMDHEQYLGDTLEAVAREKAGIIKTAPVVCASRDKRVIAVLEERCRATGAALRLIDRDFSGRLLDRGRWSYRGMAWFLDDLPLAMRGGYQVDNAALALAALEILAEQGIVLSKEQIATGLARTRWPGRLELLRLGADRKPVPDTAPCRWRFLLDGAHNPAGASALRSALEEEFSHRRLLLLWGAMADKDLGATLNAIAPLASQIWFTRAESQRSAEPEQLAAALAAPSETRFLLCPSVEKALEQACAEAEPEDLICVAGSLYLVGRVRQLLLGGLVP